MRVHKLEFLNPSVHIGRNTTVRRGDRWFNTLEEGDTVTIIRTGVDASPVKGVVTGVQYLGFTNLPIWVLLSEHDPACRTVEGLVFAMLRAYPSFQLDDMVTVITFEVYNISG